MNGVPGFHDAFLTRHNEQRYLLQLRSWTGWWAGSSGLKAQGMYDRTLIVVTADHGIAFQVGVETRRSGEPVERGGAHPGAPDREGARPTHRTREPGAGPDARRGTHDRRCSLRSGTAPTVARPSSATPGGALVRLHTRDFRSTVRISGGAGRRAAEGVAQAPARVRIGRRGPVHRNRSPPWADRPACRRRPRGRAGGAAGHDRRASSTAIRRASGLVPAQIAGELRGGRPVPGGTSPWR